MEIIFKMKIFINDGNRSKEITLDQLTRLKTGGIGEIASAGFSENASASVIGVNRLNDGLKFPNKIKMVNRGADGNIKWQDECDNLVVNVGLQHILDILFVSATTQVDPWYIGLINDNSAAFDLLPGDTMASHSTWTEDTTYSEGTRPAYVDVRSAESVTNAASTADFSINGSTTIAGAFMASSSTKGESASTLLCGGAFTAGERIVINGDTLQVTYVFSAADDGV